MRYSCIDNVEVLLHICLDSLTVSSGFDLQVSHHLLATAGALVVSFASVAVSLALQAATWDGRVHVLAIPGEFRHDRYLVLKFSLKTKCLIASKCTMITMIII